MRFHLRKRVFCPKFGILDPGLLPFGGHTALCPIIFLFLYFLGGKLEKGSNSLFSLFNNRSTVGRSLSERPEKFSIDHILHLCSEDGFLVEGSLE